jgi:epsilon-lactone hydrolase
MQRKPERPVMPRFIYTVLSNAVPGREEEFKRWYIDQHLKDVTTMPGVVSGKLIELDFHRVYDLEAPKWTLLTIYELDCDDPEVLIDQLKAASGSAQMPGTDSLSKVGMIQVAGRVIGEA